MEAIHSTISFEENHIVSNGERISAVEKETSEKFMDHYDEPGYFFRGAIFGFLLCLPFWAVIFWLVT